MRWHWPETCCFDARVGGSEPTQSSSLPLLARPSQATISSAPMVRWWIRTYQIIWRLQGIVASQSFQLHPILLVCLAHSDHCCPATRHLAADHDWLLSCREVDLDTGLWTHADRANRHTTRSIGSRRSMFVRVWCCLMYYCEAHSQLHPHSQSLVSAC